MTFSGVEINAHPLARGEWKSRGISRIFAEVVRQASGNFNVFCQLYMPTNGLNYWNLTRIPSTIINTRRNNLVDGKLIMILELARIKRSGAAQSRRIRQEHQCTTTSVPIRYDALIHNGWQWIVLGLVYYFIGAAG